MITVRPGSRGDAVAVSDIWNREIREGVSTFNSVEKSRAEVEDLIEAAGDTFLVAFEEDTLLGFVTYGQFRGGVGYAHSMEHTIHLAAAARGKGLGRLLMERIEDVARKKNVHSLIAGIAGENEAGVAFHSALGFVHVARVPEVGRKFGRWMDLILMQKIL